eukprot:COSAG06_NODE_8_length_37897_cov_42.611884_10_plen_1146_part_00
MARLPPTRAASGTGTAVRDRLSAAAGSAALLLTVALLSASLASWRADDSDELDALHRRLATLEGALLDRGLGLDAAAPRGRALQDGDCVSTSDASELAVKTAFAVKQNLLALSASVGGKAESLAAEAAAAALLANGCEASVTEPATVCEPPVDGLITSGCTVSSGGGTCAAVPHTCATSAASCPLTVALDAKAEQTALDALSAVVGEKAVAEDVVVALDLKAEAADLISLTASVGDKAEQSALDALTVVVATKAIATEVADDLALKANSAAMDTALDLKADQTEVDTLAAAVATKAIATEVADDLALKANSAVMDTALDLKADQTEVDMLAAAVATKAIATEVADDLALKANSAVMDTALDLKADTTVVEALAAQLGQAAAEVNPCRCAECAADPTDAELCASYGPVAPCECEDLSGSANPTRQTYPLTQNSPPCCREEWSAARTVTQTSTGSPQVYDNSDITVRIDGQVTFVYTGFENVEQVGDFVSYTPVTDGIRSGDPTNGGSFTHTFDTVGEYYFRSQVHDTLQIKVTVMDCVSCITVAGYEGAVPATLALALSSRAAGDFALTVGAAGTARVMTLVAVYYGQTLTLTGEVAPAGQLAIADVKADVLDGATLVVNAAYVSGGVAVAQRGTLQDNTGQVAATVSGMAVPKVVATPAIVDVVEACTVTPGTAEQEAAAATTCALSAAGASSAGSCSVSAGSGSCAYVAPATAAAVSSIDATADTVTLSVADSSIATGQLLQLIDRGGNTCAAAPKGQDLTVLSVNGLVISLSADITAGDASASSNCALSRAEAYTLPPCEAGDPPVIIYTRDASLDMDVMMTCSEMSGEAAWRSVLTMGGVIFDGTDIAGFVAAISSGLPGMYVLRLLGHAQSFVVASLSTIFPYQDVRVVSTATGDSTLDFTYRALAVKAAAQLTVSGAIVLADPYLITYAAYPSLNLGLVTFQDGVSVTLADGTTPTVDGALPGTVALELGGSTLVSISRTADEDPVYSPANWALRFEGVWGSGTTTNRAGSTFTLYLLPPQSANYFSDDSTGAQRYRALCEAAGLQTVGSGFNQAYASNQAPYNSMPLPGAHGCTTGNCGATDQNGVYWGTTSDVDDAVNSATGWSDFVTRHYSDDKPWNYDQGVGGWDRALSPVCGREN